MFSLHNYRDGKKSCLERQRDIREVERDINIKIETEGEREKEEWDSEPKVQRREAQRPSWRFPRTVSIGSTSQPHAYLGLHEIFWIPIIKWS